MEGRRITPHWLAIWFGRAGSWSVEVTDTAVAWANKDGSGTQALAAPLHAGIATHFLFSTVTLSVGGTCHAFYGVRKKECEAFMAAFGRLQSVARAKAAAAAALAAASGPLLAGWTSARTVIEADRYLAWRERDALRHTVMALGPVLAAATLAIDGATVHELAVSPAVSLAAAALSRLSTLFDEILEARNTRFVEKERSSWKTFFEVCETSPMTDEQVTAILTEEERTLLVAAAGSGKTSTVVAKVAYLLARGIATPEEILCLAFNKAAAKEMQRRITTRLNHLVGCKEVLPEGARERLRALGQRKVTSKTFHSFGLRVLTQAEGRRPAPKRKRDDTDFKLALDGLMRDPGFALQWWHLRLVLGHENLEDSQFKSEADYHAYLRAVSRGKLQADGIKTLGTVKPVRSLEEAAISNWLFLMGVDFVYEEHFAEGANILCPGRIWLPDFTYSVTADGQKVRIVHEHFGLNAEGKAPAFFADPAGYAQEAAEKMRVLGSLHPHHFWTTSADWRDGTLFGKLESALRGAGVNFAPRTNAEISAQIELIGIEFKDEVVEPAVRQIRENGFTRAEVMGRAARLSDRSRAKLFAEVCWTLADAVNDVIGKRFGVDYADMIRRALVHLTAHRWKVPYSRVIVDEFQDTAPGRGELVRRVLAGPNAPRLLAVGDDWQAINRFAGSDLRFFTRFNDSFGLPEEAYAECRLEKTFRTNQGIADIAGRFVLANNTQMKKTVVADDRSRSAVLDIRPFKDADDVRSLIDTVLGGWVCGHAGPGKPRVFVLSRYGLDHTHGIDEALMKDIDATWADRVDPPQGFRSMFSTMHSSKGMQADYVLVLGMFDARHNFMSFPSERYQDPLSEMFLPAKEAVEDAEDRRLLYVALTRAKHRVALMVHETHPSRYALELMHAWPQGEVLFNGAAFAKCVHCSEGMPVQRINSRDGKPFWGCTNYRRHLSQAKASTT